MSVQPVLGLDPALPGHRAVGALRDAELRKDRRTAEGCRC